MSATPKKYKSSVEFSLCTYSISHSSLLYRNHKNGNNIDIIFSMVYYIECAVILNGINILEATEIEKNLLLPKLTEQNTQGFLDSPKFYKIISNGRDYFIVCSDYYIKETQSEFDIVPLSGFLAKRKISETNFPIISDNQYIVYQKDVVYGQFLKIHGEHTNYEDKNIYAIFNSLEEAIEHCVAQTNKYPLSVCFILDKDRVKIRAVENGNVSKVGNNHKPWWKIW
jgi:hypothetical protein